MDAKNRIKNYINKVGEVLSKLDSSDEHVKYILKLAESYYYDAKFYLEDKNDIFTSLACIAYSEGLLDALKFLGFVEFEWPKELEKEKRVLVGGVFDLLHPGHVYLLKKAREHGRLIVIIARDENVKRLKGHFPVIPESQRLEMIKSIKYVDEAYLGEESFDVSKIIKKYKPDIILLGPDQSVIENIVKEHAAKYGVKIIKVNRKADNFPLTSSSEIIRKILKLFK